VNERFIIQRKISKEDWDNYKMLQYIEIQKEQKEVRENFEYMEQPIFYHDLKPVCIHFGCGKSLTPQEKQFGDRCISHQKPVPYTSLIEPYI
jgi:hypothetical protein